MPYWVTWDINDTTSNAIGIAATVLTLCFFLTPVKTFIGIVKRGSTQGFRGEAFQFTFFNCALWVLYAVFQGSRLMPLIANSAGVVLAGVYIFLFARYLPKPTDINSGDVQPYTTPRRYLFQFFGVIAIVAIMAALMNLSFFDFYVIDEYFPAFLFGLIADVFNVLMYGAPLTIMKQVILTKSVKYMPFLVSFFTVINSSCWLAYGFYLGDIWIFIPNASGLLLGIVQLILYACYCRNPDEEEEDSRYKPINDDHSVDSQGN